MHAKGEHPCESREASAMPLACLLWTAGLLLLYHTSTLGYLCPLMATRLSGVLFGLRKLGLAIQTPAISFVLVLLSTWPFYRLSKAQARMSISVGISSLGLPACLTCQLWAGTFTGDLSHSPLQSWSLLLADKACWYFVPPRYKRNMSRFSPFLNCWGPFLCALI